MKLKVCAVLDDGFFEVSNGLQERTRKFFVKMILQGVNTFVVFRLGNFGRFCLEVLHSLKNKFARVRRIVVNDVESLEEECQALRLLGLTDIICISTDFLTLDLPYVNKAMRLIDISEGVVCFCKEATKQEGLVIALLKYSMRRNKQVCNLFE